MIAKIFYFILVAAMIAVALAFVVMSGHVLYMDFLDLPTWEIQEGMRAYAPFIAVSIFIFCLAGIAGVGCAIASKLAEGFQSETKIAGSARKAGRWVGM